ncbi:hypothetical protein SPRG_11882 [Saprolegnia parasitica CBS 223.65]|uniref:Uncharacterized protein n=1 Tax=Saprolegnia parasitica (strain CBS 223.65) TaxID=695850 RepID=A0A067C1M6_SAPPC|nr:hypothetical protein SPRG_11882 [Saprolegnia parasitica CBS 223.65]KDO23035.1 hypothetical protein SPRG_11882 [Saprolegnia parasitica CBS 223.65]|eukprot:XP_012206323.1 hypothetical protein SPRG_11882 [Saprolegnia parasitica CBS 223.65]
MHQVRTGTWTSEEHELFLIGIQKYPKGPWRKVAELIRTRSVRQTQTHGHKFRLKLARIEAQRWVGGFRYPVHPTTAPLIVTDELPPLAHALDFILEQLSESDDDRPQPAMVASS